MTLTPTPEQKKAIEHHTGPMLVVAGAGSGKTSVLVQRIARLIREHGVAPGEILALTYTINAAERMRRGVQAALGAEFDSSKLRAQTFHGFCNGLLEKHSKSFCALEADDLKVYLNLHVSELPLKVFSKASNPGDFIHDLLAFNDRCQDDLVSAEDYSKYVDGLLADPQSKLPRAGSSKKEMSREENLARCKEIAGVYSHVSELLRHKGWGTFGNMVIAAVSLLRDARILAEEQARTRFILIDEFQDSNFGQIELVQRLGGESANVFAVGDPDQAIYRFRGATSAAFDEFRKRFPQTRTATLSTNYRSTPSILKAAYEVIQENKMAGREPLVSGRAQEAAKQGAKFEALPPEVVVTPDTITEAKTVVDAIAARQAETGCKWSDFAVLYRQHEHRKEVMSELIARGIPHEARNTDVLCAPEVRDAIAVMRALVRTGDAISYFRVSALPKFKVNADELRAAIAHAKRGAAMELVLREVKNGQKVLDALGNARKKIAEMKANSAGALKILIASFGIAETKELKVFRDFVSRWQQKPTTEGKTSVEDFCDYIDCYIAVGAKVMVNADGEEPIEIPDAVQLMTAHAAKGLEFQHVFVVRANSGSFPSVFREPLFEFPWALSKSQLAIDEIPEPKELHYQEERRLFYVACTRAEDLLAIYGKPNRWGNPERYVKELLAAKRLRGVIKPIKIEHSRVDLQARSETFSQAAEWVLVQPQQMSLEQLRLSASSIDCYDSCGMKYWLRYVWKLPEEPAATLQFGSVIHQVLRGYYDALRAGRRLDLETVLAAFRDGMENAKLDDKHQLKLYLEQGARQLTAFVESRKGQEPPKVLATEKGFSFESDGVLIQGRMDRVDELADGTVAIEDYKTGRAKDEKFAEDSLQLTIYALAARHEGKQARLVSIYNLENDTVISVSRDDEALEKGEKAIRKAAEGIRAGRFNAKPGFQCRFCAYGQICPAKEDRVFAIGQAVGAIQ